MTQPASRSSATQLRSTSKTMEYFVSHIGVIFAGACLVALAAVAWWLLTERNAELKRQRAAARRKAAETKTPDNGDGSGL